MRKKGNVCSYEPRLEIWTACDACSTSNESRVIGICAIDHDPALTACQNVGEETRRETDGPWINIFLPSVGQAWKQIDCERKKIHFEIKIHSPSK